MTFNFNYLQFTFLYIVLFYFTNIQLSSSTRILFDEKIPSKVHSESLAQPDLLVAPPPINPVQNHLLVLPPLFSLPKLPPLPQLPPLPVIPFIPLPRFPLPYAIHTSPPPHEVNATP